MGTRLFIGNLPWGATEQEIRDAFTSVGTVKDCHLVIDRETGKSKGFAFVEMSTQDEATTAIDRLNGSDIGGRAINVNEARPRPESGNRGRY